METKDIAAIAGLALAVIAGMGTFALKWPAECLKTTEALKAMLTVPAAMAVGAFFGAYYVVRNTGIKARVVSTQAQFEEFMRCGGEIGRAAPALPSIDFYGWLALALAVGWAAVSGGNALARIVIETRKEVPKQGGRTNDERSEADANKE